jgi:glycosyltransferase involved in cell wall biosynthesis
MTPASPTVSVVIPVFNRPVAIRRAIDSVLQQTWQDFEILIVDDASTDQTASVVAEIADPRIRLIRHAHRRGGSAARNSGIQEARAPYVAFLDSDDEWMPSKLRRQLELFETADDSVGLVYTGLQRILPDGMASTRIPQRYRNLNRQLLVENVVGGASVGMVRRDVLRQIGGFDEDLPSKQDVDMWLRISQRFSADFVPDPLVRVWQSDGDRITTNVDNLIRGRQIFFQKHREQLISEGVAYLWLRQLGWIYHRYRGDLHTARSLYVESIRARPVAPLTYALLVAACVPTQWMSGAVRFKNRIARRVGADPHVWSLETHIHRMSGGKVDRSRSGASSSS